MKIAINGACGRMGLTVGRLALERAFEVAAAVDVVNVGRNFEHGGVMITKTLDKKVDAVIDFSTPEASLERLEECVRSKTPMVVCTTGFTAEQKKKIVAASKKIAVLLSSNMSVGVNLLFKVVPEIARLLGTDYDIDIVETHHRFKKDAPSGTAKSLAEHIEQATGRRANIHSVRSGDVVGDHRIVFGSLGDRIEVTHRAGTRDIFAQGSLVAAQWLAKAKPGLYTMLDVLRG